MIDEKIRKIIEEGQGFAVIMAGSGSDDEAKGNKPSHVEQIVNSIGMFRIPYEVRICSAHKQPVELYNMIDMYNAIRNPLAIVAVAGGTDALSGTASFHSIHPVISCPPDAPNDSCLTNPPGSANAYIARAGNVGKFLAQMFSGVNDYARERLVELNQAKVDSLVKDDGRIHDKYFERVQSMRGE